MTPNKKEQPKTTTATRPPIVVIMGHVDHGKSTLLDYIRKSNITEGEAGGITQHIDAYEVDHEDSHGKKQKITFIDTPGHEAFSGMRFRGASVADIAILVVAADEGVKAQTLEALKTITDAKIPYIVAINKIDKAGANVDRTKQALAEAGVLVEGYGGTIPVVAISAKTGTEVPELLDMILLVSELEEITSEKEKLGEGVVIESHLDSRKGISATIIVLNGTLKRGTFIVVEKAVSPIRVMENFLGVAVDEAPPGTPVRVSGFSEMPKAGAVFVTFPSKKEAGSFLQNLGDKKGVPKNKNGEPEQTKEIIIPVLIKADTVGTLEAIQKELTKVETERVGLRVVGKGVGPITETDIKSLSGEGGGPVVIGFNVKVDPAVRDVMEKQGVAPHLFDIIYKLSEWVSEEIARRTPKVTTETETGRAKILKTFSRVKDKQIIGGLAQEGVVELGRQVKILRRDVEIGRGKIVDLEIQRVKTPRIESGNQFGAVIDSKVTVAEGDYISLFDLVSQ